MRTKRVSDILIDFSDLEIDPDNEFQKFIQRTVEGVIKYALEPSEDGLGGPYACLPIKWSPDHDGLGGEPPSDPLIIDIEIPLSRGGDDQPTWRFSFASLVEDLLKTYTDDISFKETEQEKLDLQRIRDALLRLAGRVNEVLNRY